MHQTEEDAGKCKFCLSVRARRTEGQIRQKCKETSNPMLLSLMWYHKKFPFCLTKILNQAFYMTHTFDFEVSLHYWLLWPTVRRRPRRAAAQGFPYIRAKFRPSACVTVRLIVGWN
jgi:hypothetical protein